jgi:hypothetical protein
MKSGTLEIAPLPKNQIRKKRAKGEGNQKEQTMREERRK